VIWSRAAVFVHVMTGRSQEESPQMTLKSIVSLGAVTARPDVLQIEEL